jgi:hypothetical protein
MSPQFPQWFVKVIKRKKSPPQQNPMFLLPGKRKRKKKRKKMPNYEHKQRNAKVQWCLEIITCKYTVLSFILFYFYK